MSTQHVKLGFCLGLMTLLAGWSAMAGEAPVYETILQAADFGLAGDGETDDGPALQEALAALVAAPESAQLRFDPGKTYYIQSIPETYLIDWEHVEDRGIDGQGATFLLAGDVRFMKLRNCAHINVQGLNIDYRPLPFADGVVVAKDAEAQWVDVQVFEEFALPPLGGPTRTGGEQAYFGMVWLEGRHTLMGDHYWVADSREAYPGSLEDRIIRVESDRYRAYDRIEVGKTVVSLPVRGVAHRGGDEVFSIRNNENIYFEDIEVWSAPWFVFGIHGNRGEVFHRNVNIRPKPDTRRHTSSWRDGFHVKGNYADLLWEDCHLEGLNDDAFNISTHMSYVRAFPSPTDIEVTQNFPLGIVPMSVGDTLVAYDVPGGKLLGRRTITRVEGAFETDRSGGRPRAPRITLHLDEAIPGLKENDLVWNESSANPNTILRRCTIKMSCRLQSSITLEDCDVSAFLWCYGENIEGPIPSSVEIMNSRLRQGRGNSQLALSFHSAVHGREAASQRPQEPVIYNVLLRNNEIEGHLNIGYARRVSLVGNHFKTPHAGVHISESTDLLFQNNELGTELIDSRTQILGLNEVPEEGIRFRNQGQEGHLNLMKPFPFWYSRTQKGGPIRFHRLPDALRPVYEGEVEIDGLLLEAYRVPLAKNHERYQGIYLNESIPPGFEGLAFKTWPAEEAGQAAVQCRVEVIEGDDTRHTIYESLLEPDKRQAHQVALPETALDQETEVLLHFQRMEGESPVTEWFLGEVQATRGK